MNQRNALLNFCVESCFENDTLAIYNEQLDGFGRHFRKRKEFIEQFRPISIPPSCYNCSEETVRSMKVIYSKRPFAAFTRDNINKDRALQYTSVGTIKTTYRLKSTDKKFGSQGQKIFLIALKLAQFEFLKQSGVKPILLFDDIFTN
jgi:DNA replication and repair protein RecF